MAIYGSYKSRRKGSNNKKIKMKKKKKKHHDCSYLIPSPDGRRKSTIRLNRDLKCMKWQLHQLEKFSKAIDDIVKF